MRQNQAELDSDKTEEMVLCTVDGRAIELIAWECYRQ